jgi:hypothetical protein
LASKEVLSNKVNYKLLLQDLWLYKVFQLSMHVLSRNHAALKIFLSYVLMENT